MKNLIKKNNLSAVAWAKAGLLIITMLAAGIAQTAFGLNASEYYTRYTREFLGFLGHHNPATVPVNKIMPNDRYYQGAAGYANASSININEDLLGRLRLSEASRLFTCAHEATHFALGHAYQVRRNVLEIEQEADVEAARMLCRSGYRWIVEGHVNHLRNLVNAGRGGYTDGGHPTMQQQYNYLRNVLAENNGNAVPARNPQPVPARVPVRNPQPVSAKAPVRNPQPIRNSQPKPVVKQQVREQVRANPVRNNAVKRNKPVVARRIQPAKRAVVQKVPVKQAATNAVKEMLKRKR